MIKPIGKGDLSVEFEKLKNKLAKEGLFNSDEKQPIADLSKKIAVITSESGAAIKDFYQVFNRRSIYMDLLLVPALVQGEKAPHRVFVGLVLCH